jgi:hypothetical protein
LEVICQRGNLQPDMRNFFTSSIPYISSLLHLSNGRDKDITRILLHPIWALRIWFTIGRVRRRYQTLLVSNHLMALLSMHKTERKRKIPLKKKLLQRHNFCSAFLQIYPRRQAVGRSGKQASKGATEQSTGRNIYNPFPAATVCVCHAEVPVVAAANYSIESESRGKVLEILKVERVNNAQFGRLCSGLRSTLMDHYKIQFTVEWAKLMIAFYAHDERQRSFDWQTL